MLAGEFINEAYVFLEDYLSRKTMAKLGYQGDYRKLTSFEVQYLTIIDAELAKIESEQSRKGR